MYNGVLVFENYPDHDRDPDHDPDHDPDRDHDRDRDRDHGRSYPVRSITAFISAPFPSW